MAPYFLHNLIPRREARAHSRPLLTVLASLTWIQWAMLFSGYVNVLFQHSQPPHSIHHFRWLAWACDAIDFFSVSLSVISLTKQFDRSTTKIVGIRFYIYIVLVLTITIYRQLLSPSPYFSVLLVLWASIPPSFFAFPPLIHSFPGRLRRPIRPFRSEMASSLQPHPRLHPRTRSWFCSNILPIPCSPLSVWYWNGRHLGSRSGHRPRKSSCWSPWYCEWFPPTRICSWLSHCGYYQSFLGSDGIGWVESAVLDRVRHFIVRSGCQGGTPGEWSFLESENSREGPWNGHKSENQSFHQWNQGHVEEALATLHLRSTAYDRFISLFFSGVGPFCWLVHF